MRWYETKAKPKEDPRKKWHLYFAWHPVTFRYGANPNRAWLEIVLRRLTGKLMGGDVFQYVPREYRKAYPYQYGAGQAG